MVALLKPDTFWLIVANLLLGLVTISCFAFLVVSIVNDLRIRSRMKKEEGLVPSNHLSGLDEFGITIMGEGREIDETAHQV